MRQAQALYEQTVQGNHSCVTKASSRLALVAVLLLPLCLLAGGSGLNVMVVANTASSNSLALANYYRAQRAVPPQNVLRIYWPGSVVAWSPADFYNTLRDPLLNAISTRGLTNQIDFVLLSMDIPYRVSSSEGQNSTTSALYYGFHPNSCTTNCPAGIPSCALPAHSSNSYAGSEAIFRKHLPVNAPTNSFLATMITASNLAEARLVVDRGVFSDGTFPTNPVYFLKSTDGARNIRYFNFDSAIFNTRIAGVFPMVRTNLNPPGNLGNLSGMQVSLAGYNFTGTSFVPGAMVDTLTSYAGLILEEHYGQSTMLDTLQAGASASYGTIVEPCAYLEKFPVAQDYYLQSRGFSLAECYYQSVTNPFQGLILGEPLAAPFADACDGGWSNLVYGSILSGTTNLELGFTATDPARPVSQVDLFVDGTFFRTLTNVSPAASNFVEITLNGFTTNYTVPVGADIESVASNITRRLNPMMFKSQTKVDAYRFGDRIELRSSDLSMTGAQLSVSVSSDAGTASDLTTHVRASRPDFLDTTAFALRSYLVEGILVAGDTLQMDITLTNGTSLSVAVTNDLSSGSVADIARQLVNAINATPALQGLDGLIAEDLVSFATNYAEFNLRARSVGVNASQIQAQLSGTFDITPSGNRPLNGNLGDLQPRNHLFVTTGLTNLDCSFDLDTTQLAGGWHELTAVAYEGSHVRTQKRVSQTVKIENSPLSAELTIAGGDTNIALGAAVQLTVTPNTNDIASIELITTGGSWAVISNQSPATFVVTSSDLQLGVHSVSAIVTDNEGRRFRTAPQAIQIVPSFRISMESGPILAWPASTGLVYEVWSAPAVTGLFQLRDSVSATGSVMQWLETNQEDVQFYRVRAP